MRLVALQLKNFRIFADLSISFEEGITTIVGMNGTGKTTILEAIVWAIYGNEAIRGNKETIRFNKAKPSSEVVATLAFELNGIEYTIKRTLKTAEVFINNEASPIVKSITAASTYLTKILGLEKEEFLNTYFTSQKELAFLANIKGVERGRFINKVLGYEKFREMQKDVANDKNILKKELEFYKTTLQNEETLQQEFKTTEESLLTAQTSLYESQDKLKDTSQELQHLQPQWETLLQKKEKQVQLENTLVKNTAIYKELNTIVIALQQEISSLTQLQTELKEKSSFKKEYHLLNRQFEEQIQYQKAHHEKLKIQERITFKQSSLEILKQEEESLRQLTASFQDVVNQQQTYEKTLLEKKEVYDTLKVNIQKSKQTWATQISLKSEFIAGIVSKKNTIETSGENGICPTCERSLGQDFHTVVDHFNMSINQLQEDISRLTDQEEKLQQENQTLKKLEVEIKTLETKVKDLDKTLYEQNQAITRLKNLSTLKGEFQLELKDLSHQLENIPANYDQNKMDSLRSKIKELTPKINKIIAEEAKVSELEDKKRSLTKKEQNLQEVYQEILNTQQEQKDLYFSEEDFGVMKTRLENLQTTRQEQETQVLVLTERQNYLKQTLLKLKQDQQTLQNHLAMIQEQQKKLEHLIVLEDILGQLITEKSKTAAPQISTLASSFIRTLTEGRYDAVILTDKYEIKICQEGEIKDVISGGEEDIANLCVRLALSQMIAERSGHKLSLLIFDEIFGALDTARRANVIDLIYSLLNIFQQVLLITHIDDVKNMVNHSLEVYYNEELACSSISVSQKTEMQDLILV